MLLSTVSFFTLIFYITIFFFLIRCNNLLSLILFSEIIWVILYSITVILGNINDELTLITSSFLFLALASLEFCIGFLIIIFFKKFIKLFDFNSVNYNIFNFKNNNVYTIK